MNQDESVKESWLDAKMGLNPKCAFRIISFTSDHFWGLKKNNYGYFIATAILIWELGEKILAGRTKGSISEAVMTLFHPSTKEFYLLCARLRGVVKQHDIKPIEKIGRTPIYLWADIQAVLFNDERGLAKVELGYQLIEVLREIHTSQDWPTQMDMTEVEKVNKLKIPAFQELVNGLRELASGSGNSEPTELAAAFFNNSRLLLAFEIAYGQGSQEVKDKIKERSLKEINRKHLQNATGNAASEQNESQQELLRQMRANQEQMRANQEMMAKILKISNKSVHSPETGSPAEITIETPTEMTKQAVEGHSQKDDKQYPAEVGQTSEIKIGESTSKMVGESPETLRAVGGNSHNEPEGISEIEDNGSQKSTGKIQVEETCPDERLGEDEKTGDALSEETPERSTAKFLDFAKEKSRLDEIEATKNRPWRLSRKLKWVAALSVILVVGTSMVIRPNQSYHVLKTLGIAAAMDYVSTLGTTPEEKFQKAWIFYRDKQHEEAEALVQELLAEKEASDKTRADCFYLLGDMRTKTGLTIQGLGYIDEAESLYLGLNHQSNLYKTELIKAKAFLNLDEISRAEAALERAFFWQQKSQANPQQYYAIKAEVLTRLGDFHGAINSINTRLDHVEGAEAEANAKSQLGMLFALTGETNRGIQLTDWARDKNNSQLRDPELEKYILINDILIRRCAGLYYDNLIEIINHWLAEHPDSALEWELNLALTIPCP